MKNIVFAHSGGVTSILNATASSLIKAVNHSSEFNKIYIAQNGILGLIQGNLYRSDNLNTEDLEILEHSPSSAFGSCRYKMPEFNENPKIYEKIFTTLAKYNIGYFVYQGGNDSQDTTEKIAQAAIKAKIKLKCIGIPKTVDNDLFGTDFSPGYPSAAKYLASSTMEAIADTKAMCKSSTKVFILEVMGRHTGWLAAGAAMANFNNNNDKVDCIIIPEQPLDIPKWVEYVDQTIKNKGYCCIIASEGAIDKQNGELIAHMQNKDAFGHKQLGGVAEKLANIIQNKLQVKTHFAVPDYLQRSASHLRSETDWKVAKELGKKALEFLKNGKNSQMLGIKRIIKNSETSSNTKTNVSWEIITVDLQECANLEKKLPSHFLVESKYNISQECINYLQPLIQGEVYPSFSQGIPKYFDTTKLKLLSICKSTHKV